MVSSPSKVNHMSFYQHRETVLHWPSSQRAAQFTEVFNSNPGCKIQCEDLPYSIEYPSQSVQKSDVSFIGESALIGAGKDELLCISDEPDALKSFDHDLSLRPTVSLFPITAITPQVIVTASKIETRKASIFLDCWYIACNRAIMITSMVFQSTQYHLRHCSSVAHLPALHSRPQSPKLV